MGDFNGHIGKHIDGFDGIHRVYANVRGILNGRMPLEFCLDIYVCQIHGLREGKRKVTLTIGKKETEIDFVLIKKQHQRFIQNLKALHPWGHASVVAYIDERKIRNVVKKTCTERRKTSLLKDVKIRKQIEVKVIELVDVGATNLWAISRM